MRFLKRYISITVTVCLLMSLLPHNVFSAGENTETNNEELIIVDMNNSGNIPSGVEASTAKTKTADFSAHWNDSLKRAYIDFKNNIPRDWSDYRKIEFWIYSAKAMPGAALTLYVSSDPEWENTTASTHEQWFSVDFEGWRLISIPLSEFNISRNASWKKVNYIGFHTNWYQPFRSDNLDVYIDTIRLTKEEPMEYMFMPDCKERGRQILEDSVAFRANTSNFVNKGVKQKLIADSETEAIKIEDKCYVPASVFSTCFGAKVDEIKGTVEKNGKTSYSECVNVNGINYLPAANVASALGLNVFEENGLVVVGDNIDDVKNSNEMVSYLSTHIMYEEVDVDSITSADINQLKDKWRYMLVGDENSDLSNEFIKTEIESRTKEARKVWDKMNKPASVADEIGSLFGKNAMSTTTAFDLRDLYNFLTTMALAYGTYGGELYKDEQLLEDLLYGLEWGYYNAYGTNILTGVGYMNGYGGDWYEWYINCPKNIGQILVILEDDMIKLYGEKETKKLIRKYTEPTKKFVTGFSAADGSNLLLKSYAALGIAIMEEDAQTIIDVRDIIPCTFEYVENSNLVKYSQTEKLVNGFHLDGSYVYHGKHSMTGSYGAHQIMYAGQLVALFGGDTKFKMSSPFAEYFAEWIINGYDPVMYKGGVMSMTTGRIRKTHAYIEKNYGVQILSGMLDMLLADVIPEQEEYKVKQIVKYHLSTTEHTNFFTGFELRHLLLMDEILKDETIEVDEKNFARIFGSMDKYVQHRDSEGYSVGISASSSRIYTFESLSTENNNGWYQGDGMVYVYNDQYQFDDLYWYYVNPYRLPGTTVDTQERQLENLKEGYEFLPNQDFVGGVETKDGYLTAAMSLESFHNDIDYGPQPSNFNAYGGYPPVHDSSLTAKKAWFLFDDELVALGSDIDSENGINVETIVENRKTKQTISTLGDLDVEKYKVVAVEATGTQEKDGNYPENTVDGDISSAWAAERGATLTVDLGEVKPVGSILLSFYNGNGRYVEFDLQTSVDKVNWSEPVAYVSNGTDDLHPHDVSKETRYIKFTGHGAGPNITWNTIQEFDIYNMLPEGVEFNLDEISNVSMETISVNGEVWNDLLSEAQAKENVSYAHLEYYGGMYFPDPITLNARRTSTAPSFNEFWIDHGVDPQNATYAYVLLPNKTSEETAEYAQNPDIEILCNTEKIQAVRDNGAGVTGIIFWEAGTFEDITVTEPCVLMVSEKENGKYTISVSDPTHKLDSAQITIGKESFVIDSDAKIKGSTLNGVTALDVDFTETYGQTLNVTLENNGDNNSQPDDEDGEDNYFTDLKGHEWANEAISSLLSKGVISKDETKRFRPQDNVTRGEFVKMLTVALGIVDESSQCSFDDVSKDNWYYTYVASAQKMGIVKGNEQNVFNADEEITRQDAAVIAHRALEATGKKLEITKEEFVFLDNSHIAQYASEAIKAMSRSGIINGMGDGNFMPMNSASRAQTAKIIYGIISNITNVM